MTINADVSDDPYFVLQFDAPATHFTESCPLGNGRLGAMHYGGVFQDRVVLNEQTIWSGGPEQSDRDDAHHALPEIQKLLLGGRAEKAQELVEKTFTCAGMGSYGPSYGCYQTLGDLLIEYFHDDAEVHNYSRKLDTRSATSTISYLTKGRLVSRCSFASAADQIIAYRAEIETGTFSVRIQMSRRENAQVLYRNNEIHLIGALPKGDGEPGVSFFARLIAHHSGGMVEVNQDGLSIKNTSSFTLILTARSSFELPLYREVEESESTKAIARTYADLRTRHLAEYSPFFSRTKLSLPKTDQSFAKTPERLKSLHQGIPDPALFSLYFHFGRYLLLACSRPNSPLPANLQGLWAEEYTTPWNGDFHLNINVQMNYWPAETTNLSECHEPLISFIERLVENGRKTAAKYYKARGWVAHMMTNPWYFTSPGQDARWGATNTGAAWLCQHLWEHYSFSCDETYLRRVYPVMREAAIFFLDFLIEDPQTGFLVTAPSSSPENRYLTADGKSLSVCSSPTMDCQIVRELFGNTATAARILNIDDTFAESLEKTARRLPPNRIGSQGQLLEWQEEHEEPEPHHRHISHLYGLFPACEISPITTPDFANAAVRTLTMRGDGGTGWSTAWKVAFWARLHKGDRALDLLKHLLSPVSSHGMSYTDEGGTYPNLFCAHPPFQVDGNLGGAAGIAEMLLQSHEQVFDSDSRKLLRVIHLLPALPALWPCGSAVGLTARSGISVSMTWNQGRVTNVNLSCNRKQAVVLRFNSSEMRVSFGGENHSSYSFGPI